MAHIGVEILSSPPYEKVTFRRFSTQDGRLVAGAALGAPGEAAAASGWPWW
jgi:hypothetical protein